MNWIEMIDKAVIVLLVVVPIIAGITIYRLQDQVKESMTVTTGNLKSDGMNLRGQTIWRLQVPDQLARPGLEVGIRATQEGLAIGDRKLTWQELEEAREAAEKSRPI